MIVKLNYTKFSIFDGFKIGILPAIIGSIHNLEMIKYDQNIRKSKKSSISLDFLLSANSCIFVPNCNNDNEID